MTSMEIFCCYAHKDASHLEVLKAHLTPLQRQGFIALWADTDISPGSNWRQEIEKHLSTANIILLLVSSDFMASEYCYSEEMQKAIDRHNRGEAIVIPIILRPFYWQGAPFARLQALPTGARPIVSSYWHSSDEAWLDVVNGIGEAIKTIQTASSARKNQLIRYVSQEVGKGRPISEVLRECDPNLDNLFHAIIKAANSHISRSLFLGQPISIALRNCSTDLENLFAEITFKHLSGDTNVLAAQVEKLLNEIAAVAEGDLRVQAEVTPDAVGVLADCINYLIEELASLIIRVQMTTAFVVERTSWINEDLKIQKDSIELMANEAASTENAALVGQIRRLDQITAHKISAIDEVNKIIDTLYDSVSSFRLPQRDNIAWSPLLKRTESGE